MAAEESIGDGDSANEHPPAPLGADVALSVVLNATRALLWIETAADASAVARDLVEDLGGVTVAVLASTDDALPVDLSFGVDEPVLPAAPRLSVARMLLERHLPIFVRDAQRALELADQASRLTADASIDSLTGLANRRMLSRALGRLRPGDTVIMIDLDHFKAINDTVGHQEGDRVLRILGQTLAAYVRATDRVGRYGGEEFVVIASESRPEPFLARFRLEWEKARPYPITFSAGIAPAHPDPRRALDAADRAMYRAKASGRDQWQWATKEDYL
ncbi:MAG: GGDEF domain-containing protein [Streptosporangiaceae bacterium]